ncbi:MAG: hypothetical protein P1P65_06190 [Treponema sp.]
MRRTLFVQLLFVSVLSILVSCAKEEKTELPPVQEQLPVQPALHHWRYFHADDDGSVQIKAAAAVAGIPPVRFRPWTEAVRVADCAIAHSPAVFLINKCGLYPVEHLTEDIHLPVQHRLFGSASAGNLYTVDGEYFVRIYQNSVFLPHNKIENDCFLLRIGSEAPAPAGYTANLNLPKYAQCKALEYANGTWYASFKADSGTDISFSYLKSHDFTLFTQDAAAQQLEPVSAEEFRDACEPAGYQRMPQPVKELADAIETAAPVYLRLFTEDGRYGTVFLKPGTPHDGGTASSQDGRLEADALYYTRDGKLTAAVLLPDGTCLLSTAGQEIQTFKLPPLPRGFVYTCFFLSGTQITAAWEERAFYEVGRSGLFTASLHELT